MPSLPRLTVAFHRGMSPSPKADAFQEAILSHCRDGATFMTASAKERISGAGLGYSLPFKHVVNGDTPEEAIQILLKTGQGRSFAVVTLSEEMMEAANAAKCPVITLGPPPIALDCVESLAAPKHLNMALRSLERRSFRPA